MTSILLNPCLSMPHPTKPSNFKILGLGLLFSIPIRRRNIIHTNSITCEKKDDVFYMRKCVELARTAIGRTSPNPMVGCVIVNDGGDIVGEGFHPKAGEPHAEVFALRNAGSLAENATAYVSLEPCNHYGRTPPCTEALIGAKVKRVVVGMVDPNPIVASKGVEKLRASGIDVTVGVEEMLCQKLNEAYIHRMLTGKPFVTLRYSLSFERKILNKLGQGSEEPGEHYPQMLQEYDGIVSSSNLSSRISSLPSAQETGAIQPLQIIIASGESSLRLACSITKSPDRVIVLAEKSVTVEPEYEGFKVVVLEQMKLSSIVDYCGSRELCNIVLDLRGDYGGFVTLVEDGLDENLVQKVVIELCSDQDRIEEFPILTFGRKSLRLKDLKSRALNESVIIEGYLL